MAMRRKPAAKQPDLWIATSDLAKTPGHPFYDRLNSVLAAAKFDRFVEERCEKYYAAGQGRPGIPPGVYMHMPLVGLLRRHRLGAIAARYMADAALNHFQLRSQRLELAAVTSSTGC